MFRLIKNILFRFALKRSKANYVFIVGVPRSGTTLLKSILVAHPHLAGSKYESTGVFGLKDVFDLEVSGVPELERKKMVNQASSLIQYYEKLTNWILKIEKAEVFVDKLQPRWYRILYVRWFFPKARFLHLIRDGRDCYLSAQKHPNVPSPSAEWFAKYWDRSVRQINFFLPAKRSLQLRYETLLEKPDEEVGKIMCAIGLTMAAEQLDHKFYSKTSPMRRSAVHQNLNKPLMSENNYKWKEEMSDTDKKVFESIAGKLLHKLKYDIE